MKIKSVKLMGVRCWMRCGKCGAEFDNQWDLIVHAFRCKVETRGDRKK